MRKVIMLNRISIDGYFASNNEMTGGMDWFIQDPKVDEAVHERPGGSDTLLLGEKTFVMFKNAWMPMLNDQDAPQPLKAIAEELTNMNKVVFSETMKESDWENTEFHNGDLVSIVTKLRKGEGTDILIMGSGTVVQQLVNAGLLDEYIFIVSPVIAGEGKTLFENVGQQDLKLISSRSFDSGNVVIHYETIR